MFGRLRQERDELRENGDGICNHGSVRGERNSSSVGGERNGVPVGEEYFPNLQKRSLLDGGLKRFRGVYFKRHTRDDLLNNRDSTSSRSSGKQDQLSGKAVQLPGIDNRWRKKLTRQWSDPPRYCKETSSPVAPENSTNFDGTDLALGSLNGSASGENFGSETGSESLMSCGNGSTSPRRKIRVPTPISRNASFADSLMSNTEIQTVSPRPPVTPRRSHSEKKSGISKNEAQSLKRDIHLSSFESASSSTDDGPGLACRPQTPLPGKSTAFKATLQNINEQFTIREEHGTLVEVTGRKNTTVSTLKKSRISRCGKNIATTRKPLPSSSSMPSSTALQRRKSTGDTGMLTLSIGRGEDGDETRSRARTFSRRLSMPGDLQQDTQRRTSRGIEFINVREHSRDIIQQLLIRREEREKTLAERCAAGVEERRQKKCMSWLQSLEQSR